MTSVFEEKNITKAIMRVGLPAMLGQLTTLIYNIADTFFVSLTREPAMIAAVTLCAPILLIIMSAACVFGMGGSSVIARLLGEEKKKEVFNDSNTPLHLLNFEFLRICNSNSRYHHTYSWTGLFKAAGQHGGRRRG